VVLRTTAVDGKAGKPDMRGLLTVIFCGCCCILVALRRDAWALIPQVIFKTRVSTQGILRSIVTKGHSTCNFLPLRKSGRDRPFGGSAMVAEVPTDTSGGCWWCWCSNLYSKSVLVRRRLLLRRRRLDLKKKRDVTRLLGPQASHCGQGNTVLTLVPRCLYFLACGMAAGRVRIMQHCLSGPRA
jgi:hypothetical protein